MKGSIWTYPVPVLIFLALTIGCDKEEPPIKIGFVANLAQQTTLVSIGTRNGVLMAVEAINAEGGINGRKIGLIVRDDQSDLETVIKVDRELIRENVAAIIGHGHGRTTLAALPVINEAKVVMIAPVAASSKFTGIDDYLFRINPPSRETSTETAGYAYKSGLRKMAAIYDVMNTAYAESKYMDVKNAFEALGGKMLPAVTFSSATEVSFANLAGDLTRQNPDTYLLVAGPRDTAMLCQHLRKIDAGHPILISPWAYDPEFLRNGGTAVEGVIMVHSFDKGNRQPAFIQFKKDHFKRYKTEPNIWETFGYEAVMVLSQALSRNPDPQQLKATLLKIGRFQGLQGDIVFDRYGDNRRKSKVFTVKNGAFVEIPQ